MRDRGYPPSVREIGEAIGLTSPSTVHSHLNTLQRLGYLRRDPTKPRAIEVRWDPNSGAVMERRPVRHVPLVGDVAAGTDVLAEENVEELLPVPADFTGEGELFMLRVRGDSMIEAGILDGDYVIVVQQATAEKGDTIVAGIPGGEATVKHYSAKAGSVTLDTGELGDGPDGVRRRRRRDPRSSRRRHAPPLSRRRCRRARSMACSDLELGGFRDTLRRGIRQCAVRSRPEDVRSVGTGAARRSPADRPAGLRPRGGRGCAPPPEAGGPYCGGGRNVGTGTYGGGIVGFVVGGPSGGRVGEPVGCWPGPAPAGPHPRAAGAGRGVHHGRRAAVPIDAPPRAAPPPRAPDPARRGSRRR